MIYMVVRVKFQPSKEAEFLELLRHEYVPMLEGTFSWKLVSSLKTQIGDLHEIMNTWEFEGLGEFWSSRAQMLDVPTYVALRKRLHDLMTDEQTSFATSLIG